MKVTAYLRADQPDPKGLCKIYIKINRGDDRKYHPTEIKLKPAQWDKNKKRVTNHPDEKELNRRIKNDIEKYNEEDVTEKQTFKDFASAFISDCEKNKWRAKETLTYYRSQVEKFIEYAGDLPLSQIDEKVLKGYNSYLVRKGNQENTVWSCFKFMRMILRRAGKPVELKDKPKYVQKIPTYLTAAEVEKIRKSIDKLDDDNDLKIIAQWFYLQCMLGVRVSAFKTLDAAKMLSEGKMILPAQKGGNVVSMPISKDVKAILKVTGHLTISLQDYNRRLKLIAAFAGIHKNITSHVARHTFAMRLSELKISKEVAQALLGHRKSATTDIYYRIQDKRIAEEFKDFGY